MNNLIIAGISDIISFKLEDDYTYNLIRDNFPNTSENKDKNELFFTCHPIVVCNLLTSDNLEIKTLMNYINESIKAYNLRDFPVIQFYI